MTGKYRMNANSCHDVRMYITCLHRQSHAVASLIQVLQKNVVLLYDKENLEESKVIVIFAE